jgi:tetratricopeptide (TPR) repeat protein
LTSKAWKSYEDKKYEKAISEAEECIDTFVGQAEITQEELIKGKVPEPSTNPKSKEEIEKIHSRGLLNDVGTCYFIVGESYSKLGNKEKAIEAYKEAEKFIHAMVWDPNGWFWSVSKAAAGKIRVLEKNKKP